jgi:hypothetical protein
MAGWILFQLVWPWGCGCFGKILGSFITNYTKLFPHASINTELVAKAVHVCDMLSLIPLVSIWPLFVAFILAPESEWSILAAAISYNGVLFTVIMVTQLIIARSFLYLLADIIKTKEESNRPPGIVKVYYLMLFVHAIICSGAFVLGPLHIPFAIMLYFRRKYIYFVYLLNLFCIFAGVCTLISQMKKKKDTPTESEQIRYFPSARILGVFSIKASNKISNILSSKPNKARIIAA